MFSRLQSFFEKTVYKVENNPTDFVRYLFLFAAILVVRLALEFFSSRRLFGADDILHIGLWFLFIVLAFMLQLKLFSGEKMLKVAKLVIVFFSIALSAPILDLIITKGVGAKMNYLSINSWKDFWWSYITIGGSGFTRGATPGIRLEIILLLIASFNYVRTKRQSLWWAICSVVSIYTVLFLSGTIPLILGFIVQSFHLQYQTNDQSTVFLLLSLDIFLLMIILNSHSPRVIFRILKSVPWMAVVASLMLFCVGVMLSLKNYAGNFELNTTTLFWFPMLLIITFCFIVCTGIQRLQLHTVEEYTWNRHYITAGNVSLLLMLFVAALMSARLFFCVILLWGLLFLLYEKPLQLKSVPLLRNLLEALALLTAALTGFCTFNAPMIGFPYVWLWGILGGSFVVSFLWGEYTKRKEEI